MALVRLPERFKADKAAADSLRLRLAQEARIEVPVTALAGSLWVRLSAQVYNEMADYDRLGEAVLRV